MDNIFKVTALAALMAAASNAMAGPNANVQIKGSVTQGACVPSMNLGGVYDFGSHSLDQLDSISGGALASGMELTITCASPSKIGLTFTDNRYDSRDTTLFEVNKEGDMGLGFAQNNIKIGTWHLGVAQGMTIDGNPGSTTDGDRALCPTTNSGASTMIIPTTPSGTEATAGRSFFIPLGIDVMLSQEVKGITEETTVDGNATINIIYL